MKALKKYDKDHKVLWLEEADHFSDTLFYHHKFELYTTMTDYLENDCFKNTKLSKTNTTSILVSSLILSYDTKLSFES